MCCTSPELRSASSYGHFTAAKEFRSQCHILSFVGARSVELKGCQNIFQKRDLLVKTVVKNKLRIQEGHFVKIALNLVLTLPDDGKCPALLISSRIIDLGAFCVELWSFFVSKRISVPMSYISLWEHLLISFDFCQRFLANPIYNYNL